MRAAISFVGTQAEVARLASMSPSHLSALLKREGDPGVSKLAELARIGNVSLDWVLSGKRQGEARSGADDTIPIRVLDLAYGMGGAFIDEHAEEQIEFFPKRMIAAFTKAPAEKLRVVKGIGDSMMPTISDGDLVFIDLSQDTVRMNDRVWALATGEIGMIKRLRVAGGELHAISDNPVVSDYVLAEDDYRIVGRVVACLKSL
jgi:phage repressor protein C with HTH and peptisase S24 domain